MIYLDHNATTPILPEVLEAMMPYLTTEWGNPSSSYRFGSKLKTVVETARAQVAELVGAHPLGIVFTSCATESNNAAINAALKAHPDKRHLVTSMVEHSSVLNYCKALEKKGYRVTYLPVDRDGLLNLADLEDSITDETALVSLMWANNETGVLFPVKEIAETCRARGVPYHCDAVQAAGKVEVDVREVQADYLSLTGHKFHAPKGIGALYVWRKAPFCPSSSEVTRSAVSAAARRTSRSSSAWGRQPNWRESTCRTTTARYARSVTHWRRGSSARFPPRS